MVDMAEADASGAKAAGTAVMAFSKSRRPRTDRGSGFGVRGSGGADSARLTGTSLFSVSAIMYALKGRFESSVFSHQSKSIVGSRSQVSGCQERKKPGPDTCSLLITDKLNN